MASNHMYVDFRGLKEEYGYPHTRQQADRDEKRGRLPLRERPGGGRVYWLRAELDAHFAGKRAERQRRLTTELEDEKSKDDKTSKPS